MNNKVNGDDTPQGASSNQTPQGTPNQTPPGYGQPYYPAGGMPPKKSKKGLVIGLSIGVVVIIAAIVLLVIFFRGDAESESKTLPTETPVVEVKPEDTVHDFFKALKNGDLDKMLDYMDMSAADKEKARKEYEKEDVKAGLEMVKVMLKDVEYEILDVKNHGDGTAVVSVEMKMSLFGKEEKRTTDVEMVQKDGKWLMKTQGAFTEMTNEFK
ncbi:MAG: DUF4878 domain-containing protein [Eubacteriales bacterium]|nr:DUF4878 domain-containing protein [Eubacteriales bacterium]